MSKFVKIRHHRKFSPESNDISSTSILLTKALYSTLTAIQGA